jgi:hypothetical protein
MPRLVLTPAHLLRRFPPGARWGVVALAIVVTQVGCTGVDNFSQDAAISTFAPTDLPLEATRTADFGTVRPSNLARHTADAILQSRDHGGSEFVIIDKKHATLYVFNSAVLLGSAVGDDSVPDIGSRPLDQVRPEERTTPAGRFVAERGRNTAGEDIVWVDYDAAVSMHRVRAANVKERRLERLATPSTDDNRISYGCVNIPKPFYEAVIAPTFAQKSAIVYVLPEVKALHEVFSFHGVPKTR